MKKSEKLILESSNPDEYVSNSLKSRLSPAEKAKLARLWMENTGYTRDDIIRARNRNIYWRKRKMEGAAERTRRRMEEHDYSQSKNIEWTREHIAEFLTLNRKDMYGRYLHRDWELAAQFETSIPSIQYLRRKYNKVRKMLGPAARREKIIDYMSCSELVLQHGGPKSRKRKRSSLPS
ncbi:MAG: hypothetical protein SAMD01599839_19620 [Rectinema sp.]